MYCTVTGDPVLAGKSGPSDGHIEMALSSVLIARMSAVVFAVVNDADFSSRKSLPQSRFDFTRSVHFFVPAPFNLAPQGLNSGA